ncbi:MAG: zinc-ribbon domain-containing protein [Clostridiales bacterium]|nr:zinc-ribbon domain-containing protein [Clostridiales bacterium]
MIKCEKCETQVPDGAKFCPKCGAPIVKHEQPATEQAAEQPAQQSAPAPQQKKSSGGIGEFINKYFWVLFVSTGLVAYLLIDVAGYYLSDRVYGFAVTLCVFALISAICFCVIGILNKVFSSSASAEDKKKHAVRDNVCLAVGIIMFVVVLLGVAAILDICHWYL